MLPRLIRSGLFVAVAMVLAAFAPSLANASSAVEARVSVSISDPSADLVVETETWDAYQAVLDLAAARAVDVPFHSEATKILTLSSSSGALDIASEVADVPGVLSVASERKARTLFDPDDTYVDYQWALNTINAYEAWDISRGEHAVVVAVLDTGIDWNHPDIGPNIWSDESGYHGYNFVADNRIPMDDNVHSYDANGIWLENTYTYHGTHVAGVAGAVIDNDEGIAGLAQVRLMAVKVMNESGEGTDSMVASGVIWAVDHGADIVTMSLGVDGESTTLRNAVRYAAQNDIVMVAASGNAGTSYLSYPAAYPQVIAVGATDSGNRRASFSNFGTDLDLMAPGVSVYSTQGDFGYQYLSGTSTAAPHVAGVAALMLAINPALTAVEIGDVMNHTATDISRTGYDTSTGWGIVDAFGAVEEVSAPTVTITEHPEYVKPNATYSITWMVSGGDPGVIDSTYVAWGESPTALTETTASFAGTTWALFSVDDLPALPTNGTLYLRAYAVVDEVLYESALLALPVREAPPANFFIQFLMDLEDFILNEIGLINFLIIMSVLISIPLVVHASRSRNRRARIAATSGRNIDARPLHSYDALPGSQLRPPPPPPPPRYEAYIDFVGGELMPSVVKVVEGTKVVWVNRSWSPPPGVMIKSGKLDQAGEHPDGLFQSGMLIAPGDFWSCQFHRVGVFDYYITGVWKHGKIVVEPFKPGISGEHGGSGQAS